MKDYYDGRSNMGDSTRTATQPEWRNSQVDELYKLAWWIKPYDVRELILVCRVFLLVLCSGWVSRSPVFGEAGGTHW